MSDGFARLSQEIIDRIENDEDLILLYHNEPSLHMIVAKIKYRGGLDCDFLIDMIFNLCKDRKTLLDKIIELERNK